MRQIVLAVTLLLIVVSGGQSQQHSGDESEIRHIEQRWDQANLKGDWAALETILADTFILTGDDGVVHTKAEVLSELRSRNIAYQSAKTEELRIILHGDAAVVSGRWRGVYSNRGKAVTLLERFTNFYIRRDGRWQCAASHGSAIKEKSVKKSE